MLWSHPRHVVTTEECMWCKRHYSSLYLYDYFKHKSLKILHFTGNDTLSLLRIFVLLASTFLIGIWIFSCRFILENEFKSFLSSLLPFSPFPPLFFLYFSLGTPFSSHGFSITSICYYSLKAKTGFHSLPTASDLFSLISKKARRQIPLEEHLERKLCFSKC